MTELSVRCDWQVIGVVTRRANGDVAQLQIPDELLEEPGVYRLMIDGPGHSEMYVGETDRLRTRGRQYRRADGSQKTSRWVHEHLHLRLAAGATVVMEIATGAEHRWATGRGSRRTSVSESIDCSWRMPRSSRRWRQEGVSFSTALRRDGDKVRPAATSSRG